MKPEAISTKPPQIINLVATIALAILSVCAGFFDYSSASHWNLVLETFLITGSLICLIGILKFWLLLSDQKYGINVEKGYKRDYLVGCGLAHLLILIPCVCICVPGLEFATYSKIFFAFNMASMVLYHSFFWNFEKLYKIEVTQKQGWIAATPYLIAFFVFVCVVVHSFENRYYERNSIRTDIEKEYELYEANIMFAAIYFTPFLCYTLSMIGVLKGQISHKRAVEMKNLKNIKMGESEGKETSNEGKSQSEGALGNGISWITVDESPKEETTSRSGGTECEICFMKFDEKIPKQTPRILIECGHTVCEGCVENLLKVNENHYVVCPFCQQATVIHRGSADQLPKNYGILKMMR